VRRFRFKFFSLQSERKRNGIRFAPISHVYAKISHNFFRFFLLPKLFFSLPNFSFRFSTFLFASILFFSLPYFSVRFHIFLLALFHFRIFLFASFRFKAKINRGCFLFISLRNIFFVTYFSLFLSLRFFRLVSRRFASFGSFRVASLRFTSFPFHMGNLLFRFRAKQANQTPLFRFTAKRISLPCRLVSLRTENEQRSLGGC
jgi:hypothetical protein